MAIFSCVSGVLHLSILICILNITAFCYGHSAAEEHPIPLLLLVSFDGFRWDYLNVVKKAGRTTPNFDRFAGNGVTIGNGGLVNTFVTKTFPNHYTLVTGQFEENHGVIANWFFDPDYNETLTKDNSEDQKWWDGKSGGSGAGAEPIWVTNERAGGSRVSGSYFWPGSSVDNQRPTYSRCYDNKISFADRIDMIVRWFTYTDTKPINLGTLYFEEPDHTGHLFGPNSTEVVEKIVELDGVLGYLVKSLEEKKILDRLNIIVTSDHGMTSITDFIYMDDIVDPSLYTQYGGSPVWNIRPKPGQTDVVYKALKKNEKLLVYRKIEIPEEFHYQRNRRIQEIVVSAPEGFLLCQNRSDLSCNLKGNHGYDNRILSMHPFFIANGPAFKKNFTSQTFRNVDVYPLMCKILRLVPHPNDGRLENVKSILVDDDDDIGGGYGGDTMSITFYTFVVAVGLAALVSGICCIAACSSHRIYFRRRKQRHQVFKRIDENSLIMSDGTNKQPLLVSEEDEDFA